jgi:23S rRNA A2030 N6-methylase RlmJ
MILIWYPCERKEIIKYFKNRTPTVGLVEILKPYQYGTPKNNRLKCAFKFVNFEMILIWYPCERKEIIKYFKNRTPTVGLVEILKPYQYGTPKNNRLKCAFKFVNFEMILIWYPCERKEIIKYFKNRTPTVGLEPTTTRLRALRSTN